MPNAVDPVPICVHPRHGGKARACVDGTGTG